MKAMILYSDKEKKNQKKVGLSIDEFKILKHNLDKINEYKKILFLNLYYLESEKIYKEHNFNTPEIDTIVSTYFTVLVTALYNNLELWKTFINRHFSNDIDLVKNKKTISQEIDREYYDSYIEYVVFKAIRNRLTHCELPYSDILIYDDLARHYVIYTKDILHDKHNNSMEDYLKKDNKEYYDLNVVLEKCLVFFKEINARIYKIIMDKYYMNYAIAMQDIIDKIGFDYEYAYLVWDNDDVDELSIFKVEHIEVPLLFLEQMKKDLYNLYKPFINIRK